MEGLEAALRGRSRHSLFRDLCSLGYHTSYTHAGRYYTLSGIPQFEGSGLWFHGEVGFSRAGTLKETAAVEVEESPTGVTHGELRVRVYNALLDLERAGRIGHSQYKRWRLYVSADPGRAAEQTARRDELAKEIAVQSGVKVRLLVCHLHFLADVGKGLLEPAHDRLRELFRRHAIRPDLRKLARDLGRKLGRGIGRAREDFAAWQDEADESHRLPAGGASGMAVVRGLAQWVLDYEQDGGDQGFPFDRPYLNLYNRCVTARRAVDAFLRHPPANGKVKKALDRLRTVLEPVVREKAFDAVAKVLTFRTALFEELRAALRLAPKPAGRRTTGSVNPRGRAVTGESSRLGNPPGAASGCGPGGLPIFRLALRLPPLVCFLVRDLHLEDQVSVQVDVHLGERWRDTMLARELTEKQAMVLLAVVEVQDVRGTAGYLEEVRAHLHRRFGEQAGDPSIEAIRGRLRVLRESGAVRKDGRSSIRTDAAPNPPPRDCSLRWLNALARPLRMSRRPTRRPWSDLRSAR